MERIGLVPDVRGRIVWRGQWYILESGGKLQARNWKTRKAMRKRYDLKMLCAFSCIPMKMLDASYVWKSSKIFNPLTFWWFCCMHVVINWALQLSLYINYNFDWRPSDFIIETAATARKLFDPWKWPARLPKTSKTLRYVSQDKRNFPVLKTDVILPRWFTEVPVL